MNAATWIADFGGHRTRQKTASWTSLAIASIVASTIAGGGAGGLLGLLGGLLPDDVRAATATALTVAYVVVVVSRRIGVPQLRRETPQSIMSRGPVLWATANGALLGVAVTSRIAFWLWYLVPLGCFALGSPAAGAAIWAGYGFARAVVYVAVAVAMRRDRTRMEAISTALLNAQPRAVGVAWWVAIVLGSGMLVGVGL